MNVFYEITNDRLFSMESKITSNLESIFSFSDLSEVLEKVSKNLVV
jgi:hypothetical protein